VAALEHFPWPSVGTNIVDCFVLVILGRSFVPAPTTLTGELHPSLLRALLLFLCFFVCFLFCARRC
jgi:hypothetical protein